MQYLGFSGYLTDFSQLEATIEIMNVFDLNSYRVSFEPGWVNNNSKFHEYQPEFIDYLLLNTDFYIIVDCNHLNSSIIENDIVAENYWVEVQSRVFQVLSRYANNSRLIIELISGFDSIEYNLLIQDLINQIRNMNYNNTIVASQIGTTWHKFNDPIDNTYQGIRLYFDSCSYRDAIKSLEIAQEAGIKIFNTEIGAGFDYKSFNQDNINDLKLFLEQCQELGINCCLWMNSDSINWQQGYANFKFSIDSPLKKESLYIKNSKTWQWGSETTTVAFTTGDFDGDGEVEIATAGQFKDHSDEAQLCIWNGASLALEQFSSLDSASINSITADDIDNDGAIEIITGGLLKSNESFGPVAHLCIWSGETLELENVNTWLWGNRTEISAVVIGDVDGDKQLEIVTGGFFEDEVSMPQLCIWDGSTLSLEHQKNWLENNGAIITSLDISDLDNDGSMEIISASYSEDGLTSIANLCVWSGESLTLEKMTEPLRSTKSLQCSLYMTSISMGI